jgi:hypothetical protein
MPVLIESRFGAIGNFQLLAIEPSFSPNGIVHYWRNNDDSTLPWSKSTAFGREPARQTPIESLTFIQSNFGNPTDRQHRGNPNGPRRRSTLPL